MGNELLTERHAAQIEGVLGCFDRMLIFGTVPGICFAGGMTSWLYERKIRIFDYPKFAEPYRNRIRENAENMAAEAGVQIEFIRKRNVRKEDRVKDIVAKRGGHAGLVCIFSAMDPVPPTSRGTTSRQAKRTWCRMTANACIITSYFVDEELGLCHVRVPTWLPCRLQMADNAFTGIADWQRAQRISNGWEGETRP